jgi:hypothetical protein
VSPTPDSTASGSKDPEHGTDDDKDDSDGPQDADLENESQDEQDHTECDHGFSPIFELLSAS